ncbi:MAG: hypothetical protein ABH952_07945 [Candidatus Omnitrophota bacterium]
MLSKDMITAIEEMVFETDGRRKLTCASVFKVSYEFKILLAEIGKYCNENGIKIADCQLGCF